MSKIKLEDIKEELSKSNWKVLSETYKTLDTEMLFECSEGHQVNTTWKRLRAKLVCPICNNNAYKNESEEVLPKKKGSKRVLGLDQATRVSGYSIYENGKLIKYGTFKAIGYTAIERDASVRNWLINTIKNWQIDYVGLEGIQMQNNLSGGAAMGVTTFEALARLQGILMITLFDMKIPFDTVHTAVWRSHCKVKGKSRADKKRSMQLLVKEWFDIKVTEDEADAIGIGKYTAEVLSNQSTDDIEDWE